MSFNKLTHDRFLQCARALRTAALLTTAACTVFACSDPRNPPNLYRMAWADEVHGALPQGIKNLENARDMYQQRGDERGVADANMRLGQFYETAPILHPMTDPIPPKFGSVSSGFAERYQTAAEYYDLALAGFKKLNRYGEESHVYFQMAWNYAVHLDNKDAACKALNNGLVAYLEFVRATPNAPYSVPDGYKNVDEWVQQRKQQNSCPS